MSTLVELQRETVKPSRLTFAEAAGIGTPFPPRFPFDLDEIPIAVDVLDSLVAIYLQSSCTKRQCVERNEPTGVSVVYTMQQEGLGIIGAIWIVKTDDRQSRMAVGKPSYPHDYPPLEMGMETLDSPADSKERLQAAFIQNRKKRSDLYSRRWAHFEGVVARLFYHLAQDPTWQKHWKLAAATKHDPTLPDWFPKRANTIAKWRRVYDIIQDTKADYERRYDNLDGDSPEPTIADLRDAIASNLRLKLSDKTIGRIKEAGGEDWLR